MSHRMGHGFDTHRLVAGRPLMLAGTRVPHPRGLEGHSDGDCVLHAVCDALLGALAAGDMGQHFPSADPRFKDAESRVFVEEISRLVRDRGYEVLNVDVTVVAQEPKLRIATRDATPAPPQVEPEVAAEPEATPFAAPIYEPTGTPPMALADLPPELEDEDDSEIEIVSNLPPIVAETFGGPKRDRVRDLVDSFEVSRKRDDRALAGDLKAMVGIETSMPPAVRIVRYRDGVSSGEYTVAFGYRSEAS